MAARVIHVLLVDDHIVVRRGLCALLASLGSFEVVGEAAEGNEALGLFDRVRPDLVLMDLSMPRLNGIEATRRLRQAHPDARVVILSMHEDEAFVARALQAGASGYVVKQSTPEELRLAMETVADGGLFISPTVAQPIVRQYLSQTQAPPSPDSALTPRELEVLQLIVEGRTTDQIAGLLQISPHTAHHHRTSLKQRLGARTNADLVKIAIERKLILGRE